MCADRAQSCRSLVIPRSSLDICCLWGHALSLPATLPCARFLFPITIGSALYARGLSGFHRTGRDRPAPSNQLDLSGRLGFPALLVADTVCDGALDNLIERAFPY